MVFGAAFDNQMKLGHISIEDNNELYKVKGTKYIQSSIGTTFVKVKENLKKRKNDFILGNAMPDSWIKKLS